MGISHRVVGDHPTVASLTCMPANEVAFGFRCTRRTSLRELTTTRLAEGLRAEVSLAFGVLIAMVRDEIEQSDNLVNMVHPPRHDTKSGFLYSIRFPYFVSTLI